MAAPNITDWVVLLVDDTPDNLIIAETLLTFYGAVVYSAEDGQQALDLLRDIHPTVILLDIRMPVMDGWAVFEQVRADPDLAHVPVIAVTAYAMHNDREEFLARGFDGYIAKPFEVEAFIPTITAVLEARAASTYRP